VVQRDGLALPSTYRQACAAEAQASGCLHVPAGPIPAALKHRLRFPALRPGQRCPASRGTPFHTSQFGGIALGTEPVRVIAGSTRRGIADLIKPTSAPPWLALKTLWFSLPAYQGPFVIRATRLDRPGPAALGESAGMVPLVIPPGPTLNTSSGTAPSPVACGSNPPAATPGKLMGWASARSSSCAQCCARSAGPGTSCSQECSLESGPRRTVARRLAPRHQQTHHTRWAPPPTCKRQAFRVCYVELRSAVSINGVLTPCREAPSAMKAASHPRASSDHSARVPEKLTRW
jgi:hypothetical protein